MRRESHVRACEGGGVRFPSATRLVVICNTRREAEAALAFSKTFLQEKLGVSLHPEKTRKRRVRVPRVQN